MSKLVRDRVPELVRAAGGVLETRVADDEEFARALRAKLLEEAEEAATAEGRDALLEELADVLEVIRELARAAGIDFEEVSRRAARKVGSHGAFEGRLVSTCYHAASEDAQASEHRTSPPSTGA